MTIQYLDYPNSQSIFGVGEMEFLSYEEKNKLIPQKLSDLDLKEILKNVKDDLLKEDIKPWKLFEHKDIVKKIEEKYSIFYGKSSKGFKGLLKSSLYNNSKDVFFGVGTSQSYVLVFTSNGIVYSRDDGEKIELEENYWDKLELNIVGRFLNIFDLTTVPIIERVSGEDWLEDIFNKNLVKELSRVCMNILVKSRKESEETKTNVLSKLDKDNNGTIDIIEEKNEFNLLLKKHQKIVIEKGKEFNQNYTHQFIKVGNYIKQKRNNLQVIFDSIKDEKNNWKLNEYVNILENEIHSYNLLLINSLNLIVSLIEDDQITFYEIYERFDKLNIYNSNWENELSQKLTNISTDLQGLMYEIRDMGDRIVNSIEDLSYITEESTKMLDNRLGEIDSSIKTNNLLTLIQTYQTYKINKNTKSLRE
jgi:hypothetical protein